MKKTIVVALGGNALINKGQKGTFQEQLDNMNKSLEAIVNILENGHRLVITHGNGPQVGAMLLAADIAKDKVPAQPMHALNAATEGTLGYIIEQSLRNALRRHNINKEIAVVLSQVKVSEDDPSFNNPTKPVGRFYEKDEADIMIKEKGWQMVEDAGRGYRRVVPSPKPKDVLAAKTIKKLVDDGVIVIAVGGGGIPVVSNDGILHGVDAVIDKDFASALLANEIGAQELMICTGTDYVKLNFNKPDEKVLKRLTVDEAQGYYDQGHFPAGSMGPKICAAIDFLKRGGKEVIITSLDNAALALENNHGTKITG